MKDPSLSRLPQPKYKLKTVINNFNPKTKARQGLIVPRNYWSFCTSILNSKEKEEDSLTPKPLHTRPQSKAKWLRYLRTVKILRPFNYSSHRAEKTSYKHQKAMFLVNSWDIILPSSFPFLTLNSLSWVRRQLTKKNFLVHTNKTPFTYTLNQHCINNKRGSLLI